MGGSLVGLKDIQVISAGDSVDVPIIKQGDRVHKTRSVPREWWEHVQTARDVTSTLSLRFQSNSNVQNVGRQLDTENLAGRPKLKVTVYVHDIDRDLDLPNEIDGVKVDKAKAKHMYPTCDGNSAFDPVPGGVEFDKESSTT